MAVINHIKTVMGIADLMREWCYEHVALEDQRSMNGLQCNSMRVRCGFHIITRQIPALRV
jgi:hypothetical protein